VNFTRRLTWTAWTVEFQLPVQAASESEFRPAITIIDMTIIIVVASLIAVDARNREVGLAGAPGTC
jgi:hypothetical protein